MKAVISGASKGIGRVTALFLARHGVELCVCARSEKELNLLSEEINKEAHAPAFHYYQADLSDSEQVKSFGKFAKEKLGIIDVLINNAGSFLPGRIFDEPEGTLETMLLTNLMSAYHLTRSIVPDMIDRRQGHIVNVCSIASIAAYPNGGAYGVSKFALLGFSKNLREELKSFQVKVTSIMPGATYTDSWIGSGLPEDRFIPAEDIAKIIWQSITLSPSTTMEDIVVRPQLGDI
jgi:short-subunit dehydrogenase